MSGRLDELAPAEVVVVHFDQIDRLGDYRTFHAVPEQVRIVADPGRLIYRAFDVGRGSIARVWGPRTFLAYARLMRRGRHLRRHRGDSLQLGGNVVIGSDGRVAWTFLPAEPDARPTVEQVMSAVARSRR